MFWLCLLEFQLSNQPRRRQAKGSFEDLGTHRSGSNQGSKAMIPTQKSTEALRVKMTDDILKKSNYQSFDFLGDKEKSSKSSLKYDLSGLENLDIQNKKVLDVGCNAGYFLFRLDKKNPLKMTGIDISSSFIDLAESIKDEHFLDKNIEFIREDFLTYRFKESYDLIICFSVFHYFKENQPSVLDKIYNLLNREGKVILEIEEYPGDKESYVYEGVRPADKDRGRTLLYPNELKIRDWCEDKFEITSKDKSCFQKGALFDRYFYTLIKKN